MNNMLHQLLAVEKDLVSKAHMKLTETHDSFTNKTDHYTGILKRYSPDNEEGTKFPDESKGVVTTVNEKLNDTKNSVIKAIDAVISKEETNNNIREKLIIDGKDYGEFSPTSLLALEKMLMHIKNIYKLIPTLEPSKTWDPQPGSDRDIYVTQKETTYRTEKCMEVIELSPATKEHPAQTQLVQIDKQVGQWEKIYYSGQLTPKQKSIFLERIDNIIVAVKKTRALANQAEVVNMKIGKDLFSYIHGE